MSDSFSAAVVGWQRQNGRHNLPWQASNDPYRVWLSEVMLQQTRTATVADYYRNFLVRFPTVHVLARARTDSVMAVWSGLGYYARARNLHAAAKMIHRLGFPQTAADWQRLPGVGGSTAAAVAVFCHGERAAVLDGNIKRTLARAFAVAAPINTGKGEAVLRRLAESLLPESKTVRAYTQGMMDLGAAVCTRNRPKCGVCPLVAMCAAKQRGLTASLPRRTAAPDRLKKAVFMAVLVCGGKIYLEKRPPAGIWGALWSLPEAKTEAGLRKKCAAHGQLVRQSRGEFFHSFTHYHLHAKVGIYSCAVFGKTTNGTWVSRRALNKTALPAPVRKFLGAAF